MILHNESVAATIKIGTNCFSNLTNTWKKVQAGPQEIFRWARWKMCAVGVIMSYYAWKGKADSHAAEKLLGASIALRHTGVNKDLIIRLNDSGKTFEEIADYLCNIIPENQYDNNYMT